MSISEHNLSIIIVTIKSAQVIHQCIKSINNNNVPIIVVENSSDLNFRILTYNKLSKKGAVKQARICFSIDTDELQEIISNWKTKVVNTSPAKDKYNIK